MNQLEIEELLNKSLAKAESDIEKVFNKRLKTILFQVSEMFRKFERNGELSFTELNKYNRYQKEMKLISDLLTEHYRDLVKIIQEQNEYQYVSKYLMTAYIIEQSVTPAPNMGFSIPSSETIKSVLLNPIAELTLPKVLEAHRNEIVRKINIEIAQGLIAGEGYTDIAKRIERQVGFSSKKARLVARTEAGRSRSIAAEKVFDQATKHATMTKVWASMLDSRVRMSHRKLDADEADKDGYFHYKTWKSKGPRLWGIAEMDIQCRCVVIMKVNGQLPEYRRERDYMDSEYQRKLANRIDDLMANEALTYIQALKRAKKQIQPPSRVIPYISYEEWSKKLSEV
ncbi:phage minor head protein [Paenisporosarcina cavernae]|uniref:Phage head morphogenesis protein n=1 Tax=Paenisporosarcina cavernae TaxID=2320858 RepID=A0A385YQ23_9BACL|nr:phage minor head protein [Paenisporosarcina cavernae]AYC28716.1 phage head morphogenesis protein [Paenisporosarcina cavernae]